MIEEERKEEPVLQVAVSKPKRPVLLVVLCILTFAGSGINFFSSLIISLFYNEFIRIAEMVFTSFNLPGLDLLKESKPLFYVISAAIYAMSFAGALIMWRMKKTGFHVYTIAQILLIMAPILFLHLPGPSVFDIIFSGIFVVLYSTILKQMT